MAEQQENGREEARRLEAEILEGIEQGENLAALLLKAVRALSLLTDNGILYTQAEQDLRIVYGLGLHDEVVLEQVKRETSEKLAEVTRRYEQAEDETIRGHLGLAIEQLKQRLETLGNR